MTAGSYHLGLIKAISNLKDKKSKLKRMEEDLERIIMAHAQYVGTPSEALATAQRQELIVRFPSHSLFDIERSTS